MKTVYLDNAATSFPKPPEVLQAVSLYMSEIGCNVNRGGYHTAYDAAGTVLETRQRLCTLFHFSDPRNVIFTANITMSMNMLLKGYLHPGDHVLCSSVEHNAVIRPLAQLRAQGVAFDRVPCDKDGRLLVEQIEPMLRPETKAFVLTHASNVFGTIQPLAQVGEICHAHGIAFIVDSAQTAGTEPVDMEAMKIDALAFTGHKGLLGPQGTGGFLVRDDFAEKLTPLLSGGTGSFSDLEDMPALLPDRFEAGTANLPGIFGLHAALGWLETHGIHSLKETEQRHMERFLAPLRGDQRIHILADIPEKTAVASLDFPNHDNAEIAYRLDSEYGIMTRCGLHCGPDAHKTLGTFPQGTVRFSFGPFLTEKEIDYASNALLEILNGR